MPEIDNEETDTTKDTSDEDILATARKRFDLAVDAESHIRKEALDDLKFLTGEQWPEDIRRARDQDRRPCLTINKLPQFSRQVTNDQRQNRPSIKVNPVDDEADIETAKIYQGLIRHIENNSNADVAYDTAFERAATAGGPGYFRIVAGYSDPMSFDPELFIKRVRNSFMVYLDPNYQEPDGSDSNWGFVFEDMSHEDYRAEYKGSKLADMADWSSIGDSSKGWMTTNTVRVAEYYYKTFKEVTICLLSDGKVVDKSKLPKNFPPESIKSERKTVLPAIKHLKINAVEVLEKTDWPGKWIPIIPVLGDEHDVDGKRVLEGIVRHAKDPQRMYNYWASAETETIALAPRAPFIGVEGQFEGHEARWQAANTKNFAYLEYKPKSIGGVPAGPPARNIYEPPVQAITQARAQSSDDLKATTGIYDASLGNRSNEQSGVAIQRRNTQAEKTNYHYIDNLTRALRHAGNCLIDLIPHYYNAEGTQRILGEDGQAEMVAIMRVFQKNGKDTIYNLASGKYDATVTTGPSYASKRAEAVASMLDLVKAYPQAAQVAGDLMVRNMDWDGAQEIADRMKKMLPPGIADDPNKDKQPLPPEVQQQMQQMAGMIQQLTQNLHGALDDIDKKKYEINSREKIEFAKIQSNLEIELARLSAGSAETMLKHEIDSIKHRLELLQIDQPIDTDQTGAGPNGAAMPTNNQPNPTGGPSPGAPMGE